MYALQEAERERESKRYDARNINLAVWESIMEIQTTLKDMILYFKIRKKICRTLLWKHFADLSNMKQFENADAHEQYRLQFSYPTVQKSKIRPSITFIRQQRLTKVLIVSIEALNLSHRQ